MKHTYILFSILIAIWVVLGVALFVPESPNTRGIQPAKTDKFPAMATGGDGIQRHGQLLWIGWVFGALQQLFFVALLAFGIRRRDRLNKLTIPLLFGVVLELAVMTGMFLTYSAYLNSSEPMLIGPFPAPTTIMVFGIWGAPFYYVVLYIIAFKRCIWTDDDEVEFHQLVLARRQVEESQT